MAMDHRLLQNLNYTYTIFTSCTSHSYIREHIPSHLRLHPKFGEKLTFCHVHRTISLHLKRRLHDEGIISQVVINNGGKLRPPRATPAPNDSFHIKLAAV